MGTLATLFLWNAAFAQGEADCPSQVDPAGSFLDRLFQARALSERGCRPLVVDLTGALLPVAEGTYGPEALEVADVLDLQARNLYWLADRGSTAIELARRALRIRREQAADSFALARSHQLLGVFLSSRLDPPERAEEAWVHLDQARQLMMAGAGDPQDLADLLVSITELVEDWAATGRSRALAAPWFQELLDDQGDVGKSVFETLEREGLGDLDRRILAQDPALTIALHAVALAHGADPLGIAYAQSLNMVGKVLNHRQLYEGALVIFERGLGARLRAHPPGHPQIARARHNLGEALMLVGRIDEARPEIETAYRMRLELAGGRFQGSVGTSMWLLGKLHFLAGDLTAAQALYRDALPRLQQAYGGRYYVEGLIGLAEVFEALGEEEQAERQYRLALEELAKVDPTVTTPTTTSSTERQAAAVQTMLGDLLVSVGRRQEGEGLLRAALATQQGLHPRPDQDYALTLRGLGELVAAENPRQALEYLRSSAAAMGGHPARIDVLLATAEAEFDLGLVGEATATLQRLEGLLPHLGESAFAVQAWYHHLRARQLVSTGNPRDALVEAVWAADLEARHLAPATRVLPPESALRLTLSRNRESLDLALTLLARTAAPTEVVAQVWQAVLRKRGLVVEELEERYRYARSTADPALRQLVHTLESARQHFALAQVQTRQISTEQERKALLRFSAVRLGEAERALAEKAARGRSEEFSDLRLPDVVAALPDGSALLAFVHFGDPATPDLAGRYGAFVADKEGGRHFVDLGEAQVIEGLIQAWRSALLLFDDSGRGQESRLRHEGLTLRRAVWEPVAPLLAGRERIFIVPEGSLFLLPLAALPGRDPGTYLLEEGPEFHRLAGERDLLRRPIPPLREGTMLAFGGPDFYAGGPPSPRAPAPSLFERVRDTTQAFYREFLRDPCLGDDTLVFLPLPQARQEAEEVATIFSASRPPGVPPARVDLRSATEATESAFKRLAPGHSVIHVATHGFFDLQCRDQELLHRRGVEGPVDLAKDDLVSGLAFAGANRRSEASEPGDDGILTVPEIASLDLTGVEWVVLSACETGVGQAVSGEGVLGLARGFRVAGAETLILSLWPVEDRATREWMNALYRARFGERQPTATALRSASLEILRQRRRDRLSTHPYFWAAFVASGGWN